MKKPGTLPPMLTPYRALKDIANDWPDISRKPVDHPFGPYTDGFDERQHKYGPFAQLLRRENQEGIKCVMSVGIRIEKKIEIE